MTKIKCFLIIPILYYAISIKAQTTSMASGSGIVLSNDGYIATNNHVVEGGIEFFVDVFTNGIKKSYKANVIKTDPTNDLAVIKINDPTFKKFSPLPYSLRMQGINVGEKVFAMGYPRPGLQGEEVKVTDGIISSKTGFQNDNKTYQISAPIQPGNSGGPLFDNSGNLIGLTNAGIPSGQNVGYAIKISNLNNLLDMVDGFPAMPLKTTISALPFTNKIKVLSNFTVLIRVTIPNCDLKTPSELFYKINANSSYSELCGLFNQPGEKNITNDNVQSFVWQFCSSKEISIGCWFNNDKFLYATKSFKNEMCDTTFTQDNYNLINKGLSYVDVCNIMKSKGDKWMMKFEGGQSILSYKWYNCLNQNLFYDVMFLNDKVYSVRKGDSSAERGMFGK